MTFIKVTAIGNLSSNITLRRTKKGIAVANAILIADRRVNDQEDESHAIAIRAWGPRAEALSERGVKGRKLFVEGDYTQEEDSKGVFRSVVEVKVFRWCDDNKDKNIIPEED